MSIVNLKIIFVKKQSTHANAQLPGRGATFLTTYINGRGTRDDYFCETGYSFDDSRQIGNTS